MLTSQLCDSRAMPIVKPMMVARMIPTTATRIVFRKPTRNARPKVLDEL